MIQNFPVTKETEKKPVKLNQTKLLQQSGRKNNCGKLRCYIKTGGKMIFQNIKQTTAKNK